MASTTLESTGPAKFDCLIGENYQLRLQESLQDLASEIRKETPNFSHFANVFYELVQGRIDPPLESIWVYSALSFRIHNCVDEDLSSRLSAAKDLFKLVSACSSACNPSKSIALLAPVVLKAYEVAAELLGKGLDSKREKKAMQEVKSLVDLILGYISICCCDGFHVESNTSDMNLVMPISEMVLVWRNEDESLESFFPLVSRNVSREMSGGDDNVNYLAGVVMVEAFLLKLCVNLGGEATGMEVGNELRAWAVGTVTSFRNIYFFDIFLRTLLEPNLPGSSVLVQKSEKGSVLRNILYDAAVLVDYSLFDYNRAVHQPTKQMRDLALTSLVVVDEAIEFSRENGDHKKALAYSSAFPSSHLPSLITKCIASQIGVDEKPVVSSPKSLIKWLLNLEKQGIKVFDNSLLRYHAKSAIDKSKADHQPRTTMSEEKIDDELLFYVDKGEEVGAGKEEEDEDEDGRTENGSMTAAFVAAAQDMKSAETKAKKRKGSASRREEEFKYAKYDLPDLSFIGDRTSVDNDDSTSDSGVENPLSDEDDRRE